MKHTTHNLPKITVKQLRDSLALLGKAYDDHEVQVWLSGSYIALCPSLLPREGKLLIEGNLTPGSALARE